MPAAEDLRALLARVEAATEWNVDESDLHRALTDEELALLAAARAARAAIAAMMNPEDQADDR